VGTLQEVDHVVEQPFVREGKVLLQDAPLLLPLRKVEPDPRLQA
jgi:hypothetical protein